MSSVYFTSEKMAIIDRLLVEVSPDCVDRNSAAVTIQAKILVAAFEDGVSSEKDLRRILAAHVQMTAALATSQRRWDSEVISSPHRQEHMLPSPEAEFNCAKSIYPMATKPPVNTAVIGRTATGETARIRWMPNGFGSGEGGRWIRVETGAMFDAVHWVETTWTNDEVRAHLRGG